MLPTEEKMEGKAGEAAAREAHEVRPTDSSSRFKETK